jgi:hypothetical protein
MRLLILAAAATLVVSGAAMARESVRHHHHVQRPDIDDPRAPLPRVPPRRYPRMPPRTCTTCTTRDTTLWRSRCLRQRKAKLIPTRQRKPGPLPVSSFIRDSVGNVWRVLLDRRPGAATCGSTPAGPRPTTFIDRRPNWSRSHRTSSWLLLAPQPWRPCCGRPAPCRLCSLQSSARSAPVSSQAWHDRAAPRLEFTLYRIQHEWKMAGAAQRDRAPRHAGGGP